MRSVAAFLPVWLLCFGLFNERVLADEEPDNAESISVTVVGTLRTGVIAIGGETTGVTIKAKGITWELEFGKNDELRKAAMALDGKNVRVEGSLERRKGVEVKDRWIVTVSSLEEARLKASCRRPESRIQFSQAEESTVLEIHSPFGIDRATITRLQDEWPNKMLVRLYLKGLSSFKVGNDTVTIEWSSSAEDRTHRVTLWQGNQEMSLTEDDPYFTRVRIAGGPGGMPPGDSYFEVPLPARLLKDNPAKITLQWIDFYRG